MTKIWSFRSNCIRHQWDIGKSVLVKEVTKLVSPSLWLAPWWIWWWNLFGRIWWNGFPWICISILCTLFIDYCPIKRGPESEFLTLGKNCGLHWYLWSNFWLPMKRLWWRKWMYFPWHIKWRSFSIYLLLMEIHSCHRQAAMMSCIMNSSDVILPLIHCTLWLYDIPQVEANIRYKPLCSIWLFTTSISRDKSSLMFFVGKISWQFNGGFALFASLPVWFHDKITSYLYFILGGCSESDEFFGQYQSHHRSF